LEFYNCDVRCGQIWYGQASSYARQIGLTNNLFFRVTSALGASDANVTVFAYNNLFIGGTLALNAYGSYYNSSWKIKDCVFDKTSLSQTVYGLSGASHNGYVSGFSRLAPQQSDQVVSSIAYTSEQPTKFFVSTPSSFENYGSRTPGEAGLFHFTIRSDQQKDNTGAVDIGLHYIALTAEGVPFDFDQDTLADYLEDTTGNGIYGPGDLSNYQNPDTDGDGLPDAYEYLQTHTSTTVADTGTTGTSDAYKDSDSDGLLNQEEYQSGKNPYVPDVATPLFSILGGTYASVQTVTITCPTTGATNYYTLNGDEPTTSSTAYSSPITVPVNTTLKAKAFKTGWTASDTETERYQTAANAAPTVSVLPGTGLTFGASDSIEFLVQGEDSNGTIAKLQLYRGSLKVAEAVPGPLRFTLRNVPSGSYSFTARAIDNDGAVTVSSSVSVTINTPGPSVSLVGAQPFFTSSPGALLATVTGINPGALTSLTLNGNAVPLTVGSFALFPALSAGENTFTLLANGAVSATTKVYLDTTAPSIAIAKPANSSSLSTERINVTGTYTEASLKRITVNGVLAFIPSSGNFEARNVPLVAGSQEIIATIEDIAGNTVSVTNVVTGSATPVDPVQLAATPVAGFSSLSVTFSIPVQNVSGTAYIDFDGSGGQAAYSSSHSYSAGQYFPVVTVQATDGNRFSSLGGWNASPALRVNVQEAPQQVGSAISIPDPVDLKVGPDAHLFILSRSLEIVKEYDATPSYVRSIALPSGSVPTGLDVDSAGNVYVALSGHHQVAKYKFDNGSYVPDTTFNTTGLIGKTDQTSGTGNGQFNTPFDVAVTPDGGQISVSDSGNHRIQNFTSSGVFINAFGSSGSGAGQFSTPKGLAYNDLGHLYIADSGNNRIALADSSDVLETSGITGSALGQFQGIINLALGNRGLYVADTGNNRVQCFDPQISGTLLSPRSALTATLFTPALSQPYSIASISDLVSEKIYVADNANDRVLLVSLPFQTPEAVWTSMKQDLIAGDIEEAISYFATKTGPRYREIFVSIGAIDLASLIGEIGSLSPVFIENDSAQYYFEQSIDGETIAFPIDFIMENGKWRILEF
jgi:hypothetical protein